MNDVATLGILRDVFVLGMVALAMGLLVYAGARAFTKHQWHTDGNVLSLPYDFQDGIVAMGIVGLFCLSLLDSGSRHTSSLSEGGSSAAATEMSFALLLGSSVIMLMMCVLLLLYLRMYRGLHPAEIFGFRQMRARRAAALAVPLICLVVIVMACVIQFAYDHMMHGQMPKHTDQEVVDAFKKASTVTFRVLVGVTAIVIAPLTEEIIFRGFLYGVTKRFTDRWFAAVFTALIFAVVHSNVSVLLPIFLLGIGLAFSYEATGCLLVPMFMHAMFNAFNLAQMTQQ